MVFCEINLTKPLSVPSFIIYPSFKNLKSPQFNSDTILLAWDDIIHKNNIDKKIIGYDVHAPIKELPITESEAYSLLQI